MDKKSGSCYNMIKIYKKFKTQGCWRLELREWNYDCQIAYSMQLGNFVSLQGIPATITGMVDAYSGRL